MRSLLFITCLLLQISELEPTSATTKEGTRRDAHARFGLFSPIIYVLGLSGSLDENNGCSFYKRRQSRIPACMCVKKFYHNNSFFSIQTISEAITTLTHQSSSFCIHFIALRLISPHGDKLVNLMVDPAKAASVEASATRTLELSDRNACDVELLCVGGFSPLTGFMNAEAYDHVVENMRLPGSNLLFGLPIVLDTDCEDTKVGDKVLLRYKGKSVAVLTVDSKWRPNKPKEAKMCYGTSSIEHPGVHMIAEERGRYYIGGSLEGLAMPVREFATPTPAEVRADLPEGKDVVAFQCRNPIHRAHYELFTRALDAENVGEGAVVLVHPTMGPTQDDDISGLVRYKTYVVLKEETKNPQVRWAYLPYSMHMAGPREAIQHMIIRKNYGCTHFIIGRDMAGLFLLFFHRYIIGSQK